MKKLFVFILLASTTLSFVENNEDRYLFWKPEARLRWPDFRGHVRVEDEDAASASYIGFLHQITKCAKGDSMILDTRAFFNKSNSWVKIPAVNPSLLSHEQLHFDLAELYSRRFRQAILSVKANERDFIETADSLFRYYAAKSDTIHFDYDLETNHGLNEASQRKWDRIVRNGLLALGQYQSPYLKIAIFR
jgi:hypothetical protein